MSAWPFVAWKLAKQKDESFVAHALLCLTLCIIGKQSGDLRLLAEASRHYDRVLHQFQAQVSVLATTGYSARQDDHVASLAAAGFCCSQVEYILHSWANGDRHLQGMASLLEACGPACLKHDDTRTIFYDHFLLWTSCSIVHRRPFIYSQPAFVDSNWCDLPPDYRDLITIAARIPPMLEEYDHLRGTQTTPNEFDLLQRLIDLIVDIEAIVFPKTHTIHPNRLDVYPYLRDQQAPRATDNSYCTVIMEGYASAFVMHAGIAAWEIVRTRSERDPALPYPTPYRGYAQLTDEGLRSSCEEHLAVICESIDQLADERFGMITSSPLLFLLDSAWMGYRTLQDVCGYDIDAVRPWFAKIGDYVAGTGFSPLREPWLTPDLVGSAVESGAMGHV